MTSVLYCNSVIEIEQYYHCMRFIELLRIRLTGKGTIMLLVGLLGIGAVSREVLEYMECIPDRTWRELPLLGFTFKVEVRLSAPATNPHSVF